MFFYNELEFMFSHVKTDFLILVLVRSFKQKKTISIFFQENLLKKVAKTISAELSMIEMIIAPIL